MWFACKIAIKAQTYSVATATSPQRQCITLLCQLKRFLGQKNEIFEVDLPLSRKEVHIFLFRVQDLYIKICNSKKLYARMFFPVRILFFKFFKILFSFFKQKYKFPKNGSLVLYWCITILKNKMIIFIIFYFTKLSIFVPFTRRCT